MKKTCVSILIMILVTVVLCTASTYAAELKLIPSGKGIFVLQGYNIANAGGIKAVIEYQNLKNPRVQSGSLITNTPSPMFVPNVNIPGKVIIAAIQATNQFNGTGPIAVITFDTIPGSTGTARLTGQEIADEKGHKDVTADASPVSDISDPGGSVASGGDSADKSGSGSSGDQSGKSDTNGQVVQQGSVYLGRVTMPTESGSGKTESGTTAEREQEPKEDTQQEQSSYAASSDESGHTGVAEAQPTEPSREPERAQPGTQKFTAHKGLLDQFREYKGELTPQALTALVAGYTIPGVRQEPAIALSDGKTVVKVYLDLPAAGTQSPNFALKGAKLVSLKNDEKGKWVIEALPAKNTSDVRITALQDNVMTEIPLTVVQPVPATAVSPQGAWDEATYTLFLKDRGGEKAPHFDLNGDGTRNHIDDYIYTVNYLIRNPKPAGVKAGGLQQATPVQQPAVPAVKPVRPK